ncbi:cytochrome C [Variovorax dokdonensis]|uniref:Cytochrome C n=1 Tax=Variovorax dokdonensis TaxID=344883 RepID=A0ABT7N918_9BURK|nr:cytochrome C [Variovorax dokdonensis]MDM0044441.1 cytochrome C [Variovorax dokdonensis]
MSSPTHEIRHRRRIARSGRAGAVCAFAVLMLAGGAACAQARGYMLYSQHCIECHTEQVHWRDGRLATDWQSLNAQVRRWQAVARLNWSEEDIQNVTRHLNTRYYDFWPPTEVTVVPVTAPRASRKGAEADR